MWNIIIGLFFIIGGASGHMVLRGTNSSIALIVVGIILIIYGIIKMTLLTGDEKVVEAKEEECTVIGEKLIVYNKSHESLGILTELETSTKFILDFKGDFNRFYQVRLASGQIGYILKTSKYSKN